MSHPQDDVPSGAVTPIKDQVDSEVGMVADARDTESGKQHQNSHSPFTTILFKTH